MDSTLHRNDAQHLELDTVELVETTPQATHAQTLENLRHVFETMLIRTIGPPPRTRPRFDPCPAGRATQKKTVEWVSTARAACQVFTLHQQSPSTRAENIVFKDKFWPRWSASSEEKKNHRSPIEFGVADNTNCRSVFHVAGDLPIPGVQTAEGCGEEVDQQEWEKSRQSHTLPVTISLGDKNKDPAMS